MSAFLLKSVWGGVGMRTLRPRKIFEYVMLSYPSLTHTFVSENCDIWGGQGMPGTTGSQQWACFWGFRGRPPATGGVRAAAGRCRFKDALRVPAAGCAGCSVTSRPRPAG